MESKNGTVMSLWEKISTFTLQKVFQTEPYL